MSAYTRRFSRTVRRSHNPGDSVRNPIRLRSFSPVARDIGTPAIVTDPLVGAINPASIRIVVVLPAPFGPSSATISDCATSNVTSSTTVREPKRRVRAVAAITGLAGSAGQAGTPGGAKKAGGGLDPFRLPP